MYNAASEKGHSNIVAGLDEYNENITRYCFDGMSRSQREADALLLDINRMALEKRVSFQLCICGQYM